jgi:transcriptional regulator with XRE-family HTH domain
MNKIAKLPDINQAAFKAAREKQGLSTKDLAGKACLSAHQIEQIENGGLASFYGVQIKFTAAKKVALILGLSESEAFETVVTQAIITEAPATENVAAVVSAQAEVAEIIEVVESVEVVKVAAAAEVAKEAEGAKVAELPKVNAKPHQENPGEREVKSSTASTVSPRKKRFLVVGLIALAIFAIVNLRPLFFPDPVQEVIVVEEKIADPVLLAEVPPAASPTVSALGAAPVAAPSAAPSAALVVSTVAPPTTQAASEACPSADVNMVSYKPASARKSGDMVYMQAKTKQIVCVTDASGKSQLFTIEPEKGASFYGKPPFKVLTSGLALVDLYFQGGKVRLDNAGAKTILLEPVEFTPQPAVAPVVAPVVTSSGPVTSPTPILTSPLVPVTPKSQ